MARKKKSKRAEYEFLSLRVEDYSASVEASINYQVRDSRHRRPEALVYGFGSHIEIEASVVWPEERADQPLHLTVYGHEPHQGTFDMTLDDCHVIDESGSRKYQKKRGEAVPVYNVPKGIGNIEKVRGVNAWSGYAWVTAACASDMMALLPNVDPLYLSIHEMKEGRSRFIVGLTLQTVDPSTE